MCFSWGRGDSPGFSVLVSDAGHPEASVCLELPVSEGGKHWRSAGAWPSTDLVSRRAGEKTARPQTGEKVRQPSMCRWGVRPSKRFLKLAFPNSSQVKNMHFLRNSFFCFISHKATRSNNSLMEKKKETSLETVNIILLLSGCLCGLENKTAGLQVLPSRM